MAGRYIEPRNPLFGHFPAHYVSSRRGHGILHWGGDHPSRLVVPVVPAASESAQFDSAAK